MSVSRNTSMCFALRVLRMQIGNPADLSARQPRYFLLFGKPHGCGECRKCRSNFRPKESIQRKGHPMPLDSFAPEGLNGVFGRAIHSPPKTRCIPASPLRAAHSVHPCTSPCGCCACKSAILPICPSKPSGARRGIRGLTPSRDEQLLDKFAFWVPSSIVGCCRR